MSPGTSDSSPGAYQGSSVYPPPGHFVAEGISTGYQGVAVDIAFMKHVHTFLGKHHSAAVSLSSPVYACWVLCRTSVLLQLHWWLALASSRLLSITEAKKASAMPMEPSLEALLRQVNLHEDVIWKFRVIELCGRELSVSIDRDEDALRETMKSDFGLDPLQDFVYKRELAKVLKAWNIAKVQSEAKVKADAAARAHGVPTTMLEPDWASFMDSFKIKFGSHISSSSPPAQSFSESSEEMLANGTMKAVTLAHVVSAKEQEDQEDARPEPSGRMGMRLDCTLTIQTRRRYMSSTPTATEGLRQKYIIMSNCWLLAQMRQPARHLFSDLTVLTFPASCDELLKEIGGHTVIKPEWDLCLGYSAIRRWWYPYVFIWRTYAV